LDVGHFGLGEIFGNPQRLALHRETVLIDFDLRLALIWTPGIFDLEVAKFRVIEISVVSISVVGRLERVVSASMI
jgi:hypothetical protein